MRAQRDATARQVTRQIADALATVEVAPFASGVELMVTLTSGSAVRVPHGLGRKWRGWLRLALLSESGAGYEFATRGPADDKFITLTASGYTANPELVLWVF